MTELRTDISLIKSVELVVLFDRDLGRVDLMIQRLFRREWQFETPRLRMPSDAVNEFLAGSQWTSVAIRHPDISGALEIKAERTYLVVRWESVEYRTNLLPFVGAIKPPPAPFIGPPRPLPNFGSCRPGEDQIEEFKEVRVRDGILCRVERRRGVCWITVSSVQPPVFSTSGELQANLDLDDWEAKHKWITCGGSAIQLIDVDRVALFSDGNKRVGTLKLSDLRDAIVAMGGQVRPERPDGTPITLGEDIARRRRWRGQGERFVESYDRDFFEGP